MDDTRHNGQDQVNHAEQLATCHKEMTEWKDKSMRIQADFENYKRRAEKERAQWVSNAQTDVLLPLLAIVDNVDRALADAHSKERSPEMQAWLNGFIMIGKSLPKLLESFGVKPIADVTEFDPLKHEAIMSVPASETHPAGTIVAILQQGYTLNGQVLRPAQVSVAQ